MTSAPIDVIIPIHNQIDLASQCINSVLNARTAVDCELIVIDDASTDPKVSTTLAELRDEGRITLFTNPQNFGFTRTVNFGMKVHADRDVLLLNSDTIVYDDWLDRIAAAAVGDRIATVNPMTNQGAAISAATPCFAGAAGELEVDNATLHRLAAEMNAGKRAEVHTTVGFCMFIQRACLNDIGYFDSVQFPVAYGEESDFCYRARKAGWRHMVAGDVFVTHLEGQSFSERKAKLMADMLVKFSRLHPEFAAMDAAFQRQDPVRALRRGLDIGRIKLLLAGETSLGIQAEIDAVSEPTGAIYGTFSVETSRLRLRTQENPDAFPNVEEFDFPREISSFNYLMRLLGVTELRCSPPCKLALEQATHGLEYEISLAPAIIATSRTTSNFTL